MTFDMKYWLNHVNLVESNSSCPLYLKPYTNLRGKDRKNFTSAKMKQFLEQLIYNLYE